MRSGSFVARVAVVGLLAAASLGAAASHDPAVAQAAKGGLYAFHTRAVGACPGLDWHITVEPNGGLIGFVAWDQMKHMARLAGNLNKDRSFEMNAEEVGGAGRKATVKGTAAGDYITASIDGSGTGCDKQVLQIPRVTGGLQGGGG
jgi:hypothetical protein